MMTSTATLSTVSTNNSNIVHTPTDLPSPVESEHSLSQDLSSPSSPELYLTLYNFDSPAAAKCPYVLTSPRSLQACARLGIKPVDLLQKTLLEFLEDQPPGQSVQDLYRLYEEYERTRLIKLKRCREERENIMRGSMSKRRSQSLSPLSCRKQELEQSSIEKVRATSAIGDNQPLPSDDGSSDSDDSTASVISAPASRPSGERSASRSLSRPESRRGATPKRCWSTPCSPFHSSSQTKLVPISSPKLKAKLENCPKARTKLPPRDIKIMELMVQRHEDMLKEEEKRVAARKSWEEEKAEVERKRALADERRRNFLAKIKQKNAEEASCAENGLMTTSLDRDTLRGLPGLQDIPIANLCSPQSCEERTITSSLKPSYRRSRSCEDKLRAKRAEADKIFHESLERKIKKMELKEEQLRKRRETMELQRQSVTRKSTEELEEKLNQARTNQMELNRALEIWRQKVASYQIAANQRAALKAAENIEMRRKKVQQERLAKEAEHKKNMHKIEMERDAKLQEMWQRLRYKEERSKMFTEEKFVAIQQSRAVAQASSDLREFLKQRLSEETVLRRSRSMLPCTTPSSATLTSPDKN